MSADETETNIQKSCFSIMNNIRSTNLNYAVQETPFSIYVTIRKSLIKSKIIQFHSTTQPEPYADEISKLKARCNFLEHANETLKMKYEDEVNESEVKGKLVAELEKKLEILSERKDNSKAEIETKVAKQVKSVIDEKRSLQIKHAKICAENKTLKNENETLKKDLNTLNVACKSAKKESKDNTYKLNKKCEELEAKIKDLTEFKIANHDEEKDFKTKLYSKCKDF